MPQNQTQTQDQTSKQSKYPSLNIPLTLAYDDVLLVPQYSQISSRSQIDLTTQLSPNLTLKLPFISANMDTVTGTNMAIKMGKLGGLGLLPRFDTLDSQMQKIKEVAAQGQTVAIAIGIKEGYMQIAQALVDAGAKVLTIDVAHGHMQKAIDATKNIKNTFGEAITLISGNIATYDGAENLFNAGADCVKVGIGPGSICTTRIMTGFGVPQITALLEVAKSARNHKKTFIADGGIKNSGDIVKALATGASAVMCGAMFAGTDEAPGNIVELDGKRVKEYNGSTSQKEKYRQGVPVMHIEGVAGFLPYKGPVDSLIESLAAGVRSGLSYAGAKTIEELWAKAQFVQITGAGLRESQARDIYSTSL